MHLVLSLGQLILLMYPLRLLSLQGKQYSNGLLVPPNLGLTIPGVDHSKPISIGGDIFTGQQMSYSTGFRSSAAGGRNR